MVRGALVTPVEIVLTDEQALMASVALDSLISDENYELTEEEEAEFERLSALLKIAAQYPSKFPVTGKLAPSVRKAVRRVKGAAQPKPVNARKARQERRQGYAKERRRLRREHSEAYNRAVEQYEAEARERAEIAAEQETRWTSQPQYKIVAPEGDVIVDNIPAELIQTAEGEPAFPKLIVVGEA